MTNVNGEWFAVLSDTDASLSVASRLRPLADREIQHPSGRPWLMGRWVHDAVTVETVGPARAAVVGCAPAARDRLRGKLAGLRSVDDAEVVAAGLPGSHHLLVSMNGRVRAQGSLADVRRVFRADVDGVTVAADSMTVLARLSGADWDRSWIAARLTATVPPFPLHEATPWQGIRAVPGDDWLALEADGRAAEKPRGRLPEPTLSLAEGTEAVREALTDAVRARTADTGTVSVDLSGGMDSTSLAFLAADAPARLVTHRWAERDSGNDDAYYAQLAAEHLPDAVHRVLEPDEVPPLFAGLGPGAEGRPAQLSYADEPFAWVRNHGRLTHLARTMAAEGSRVHLTGTGGDELFQLGHQYLYDVMRSRPRIGLRYARTFRNLARWSWPALARELARRGSPARELRAAAGALNEPPPGHRAIDFRWSPWLRMPSWATSDATGAARDLLRAAADGSPQPLAAQRAQHRALFVARCSGATSRLVERAGAAHGVPMAVPYLDDQVLEAALSVRLEERNDPGSFKPLLAAAMRDIVPRRLLERTTKGNFGAEVYHGVQRHRAELLDLFDQSELARHGLIDAEAVRAALLRTHPDTGVLRELGSTLACELWLRSFARSDETVGAEDTGVRVSSARHGRSGAGTGESGEDAEDAEGAEDAEDAEQQSPARTAALPDAPLALRSHVTAVPSGSGMVVLDQRSGRYWQINSTAAVVLRKLLAGATAREAADALAAEHPKAAGRAEDDVAALVRQLERAKLIEAARQ